MSPARARRSPTASDVAFTDDWQADAARRDFTMNAVYHDPLTGLVEDPFGGLEDLAAGRLRHTSAAFGEDPVHELGSASPRVIARRTFRTSPAISWMLTASSGFAGSSFSTLTAHWHMP